MQEIIKEIVKKEAEAKSRVEKAQKTADEIIADAKKQAERIIAEAKATANKISMELKKQAEGKIKEKQAQILNRENNRIEQIKLNWQEKIASSSLKIFNKIVDIRYLTGKLFE